MKQNIRALVSSRKLFFNTILLLLLSGTLALILFGETVSHIPANNYHPFWLNVFFINYTFIGNGLFVITISLILVFRFNRKQLGFAMLNSFLLSAILIQVVKNISNIFQPAIFIEQGQYIFSNNDPSVYTQNFVSGHTVIAFAMATVLILTMKNPKWQLPLLFGASLLGFSRIYLAQHLLFDIIVGAMAGTIVGITTVYFTYYDKRPRYNYKKFLSMNRSGSMEERNVQPV